MIEVVNKGSDAGGHVDGVVPDHVVALSQGELGSRVAVEREIDTMLATTRGLWEMEPDEAMRLISAMSARCTELYVHLHRVEGRFREWKQVRTMQVDRLLQELERQFRIASRIVEVRRHDLEMMKGT